MHFFHDNVPVFPFLLIADTMPFLVGGKEQRRLVKILEKMLDEDEFFGRAWDSIVSISIGFCSATLRFSRQVQVVDFPSGCQNFIKNVLGEWMYMANVMKSAFGRVIPSPACLVGIQIGEVRLVRFIFPQSCGFVVGLNIFSPYLCSQGSPPISC